MNTQVAAHEVEYCNATLMAFAAPSSPVLALCGLPCRSPSLLLDAKAPSTPTCTPAPFTSAAEEGRQKAVGSCASARVDGRSTLAANEQGRLLGKAVSTAVP